VLAVEADGREVTTVEGLAQAGQLHALQKAFIDHNAVQCGFCTPGMLMSGLSLIERNPDPTADDVREALVGNLCRCTGYLRIIEAVQTVAVRSDAAQGATLLEASAGSAPGNGSVGSPARGGSQ
jgi:carbon-monoxide dehydrogenase small subunit